MSGQQLSRGNKMGFNTTKRLIMMGKRLYHKLGQVGLYWDEADALVAAAKIYKASVDLTEEAAAKAIIDNIIQGFNARTKDVTDHLHVYYHRELGATQPGVHLICHPEYEACKANLEDNYFIVGLSLTIGE